MRALLAAVLVVALAAVVAVPHVHAGAATDDCAVCVLRHADAPSSDAPDVAPAGQQESDAVASPGLPPVTGRPLGAVPGQSPPARP